MKNFELWVAEIKRKLKSEAYDVLESISWCHINNQSFGAFTEPLSDPRKINRTDILQKFEEAKGSLKLQTVSSESKK